MQLDQKKDMPHLPGRWIILAIETFVCTDKVFDHAGMCLYFCSVFDCSTSLLPAWALKDWHHKYCSLVSPSVFSSQGGLLKHLSRKKKEKHFQKHFLGANYDNYGLVYELLKAMKHRHHVDTSAIRRRSSSGEMKRHLQTKTHLTFSKKVSGPATLRYQCEPFQNPKSFSRKWDTFWKEISPYLWLNHGSGASLAAAVDWLTGGSHTIGAAGWVLGVFPSKLISTNVIREPRW